LIFLIYELHKKDYRPRQKQMGALVKISSEKERKRYRRGIKDGIGALRMMAERILENNQELYIYYL